MSIQSINQVVAQMRVLAAQAQGDVNSVAPANNDNFKSMLKSAIDNTNSLQMESGKLQSAFEQGDSNVNIAQVMIASQKAGIAFQGVVQVRNRLVQAYQDIMNMPI